jgi:ABC-type uncharacterized transport system YnjBCD substrate-binding protein
LWRYKFKLSFDNCEKRHLYTLLATYNLTNTIYFPTRIQNGSVSATDNIFIDLNKNRNYTVCPFINWLSDHNAQIIKLNNINTLKQFGETQIIRNFSKYSITEFKIKLSYKTWNSIFVKYEVIFNNFLNIHLRTFYTSCTKRKICF